MPPINVNKFKGLAQNVVFEELGSEFCHTLENLDIDNPVGKLVKRSGTSKKYTDAFTDIISAFEYEYPASGDKILIFNDNGTLKYYTDDAGLASLTLPTGATMEANFRNQYFGFKNGIQITSGNGATNYVLGFYYINRVNSSNTGLFGNNEQFTGYKLLQSQLISRQGVFSRVYSHAQVGSYHYLSFESSKWIEKRDSNFQLVERILSDTDASDLCTVSLDSDGTNIFMGISDAANSRDGFYRIDPNGWVVEEFTNLADVVDVAVDDAQVYVCQQSPSSALRAYLKGNFAAGQQSADTSSFDGVAVACFNSGGSHIYTIRDASGTPTVERRDETAVGTVTHTYNTLSNATKIECTTNVWVSNAGVPDIRELAAADLTLSNTYTGVNPGAFVVIDGVGIKVVNTFYGMLQEVDDTDIYTPELLTLNIQNVTVSGNLDAGTYFYKFSVVDSDGQEFTLSDPVIVSFSAASDVILVLSANADQLNDLYRVASLNVYRAYNSDSDAETPATNYKFLTNIDINSAGWTNTAALSLYYISYTDQTTEANISSVTYEENSGISENTNPRFVNYKAMEWIVNQLHAVNMYVDGETYKNKIAKSQVNAPDAVAFANTYDFDPYDGDEIINITTAYSRAYIFKQRRTGVFYNDRLERRFNQGLADIDAYYTEVDDIFFIGNKGLFWINGANLKQLVDPVITSFNAVSSFTDCNVFYQENFDRIWFVFPEDRVLVYSRKHNAWMEYTANAAYRGMFKNLDEEYIAFGKIPGDVHFFVEFDDSGDDANDTDITVKYETPLLKLDGVEGFASELTQIYIRYKLTTTSTPTLKIYDWRRDSKATSKTINLSGLTTISTEVNHLTDVWGEAFSIELTGIVTVFEFSGLTLHFEPAGLAEDMHA